MGRTYNHEFLLRMAQADAYCADYVHEKYKRAQHEADVSTALRFSSYGDASKRTYTAPTQFAISMCEMLRNDNVNITSDSIAEAIIAEHTTHPRSFHEPRLEKAMVRGIKLERFKFETSITNGTRSALTRAAPFGILHDLKDVMEGAVMSAMLTERSWSSINSSISIALMMHYAIYRKRSLSLINEWVTRHHPFHAVFEKPWHGPVNERPVDARKMCIQMNVVCAVNHLLTNERSMMGILSSALRFGGEVSTVASIAWGIAAHRYGDEKLPEFFDRDFCQSDTRRLLNLGSDLTNVNHNLRTFNLKRKNTQTR